jgi:hypothetical protein
MINYAIAEGALQSCRCRRCRDSRLMALNETIDKSDQEGSGEDAMKRFAVFAIVGPLLAAATLFLILLPVASVLEGVPIDISSLVVPAYGPAVLAALVVALFDWVASLIEVPSRPVAAAIVGWVLAFILLGDVLALPDLPGWFAAIGLLGAIPGFVCSWLTIRIVNKASVNA